MKKETKEFLNNEINIENKKIHLKKGVSMITVIITIIVIIILAAIAFVGMESTTGNASHAKFGHELSEIEEKVKAKQTANAELGVGEEVKHTGFTKVVVEGAPDDFVSFDNDEITGYWVNMKTINEDTIKTGHEELTEMKVRFNYQDVYVYDAEGKVYYAKGWYDGDEVLHYRLTTEETTNKTKPEIVSATYELSEDKKSAIITVVATPASEVTLEVTIGGKTATKVDENTYTITVTENGTKNVVVKESTGGSATTSIQISGIEVEEEKDTTPPEITNLTSKVTGKTVLIEGNARDNECNIVGYKFTTTVAEPTSWESVNTLTLSVSHIATVSGPYYLWVKNEEGLVSSKSINVTVPEIYTIKYNANGGSLGNVVNSQEKIQNQNITLDNNSPARTGHTFKGWGTSSNATTATYQPGNTYTGNANIELFAIWEAHKYTVTYNANGGSLDKVVSSQEKTYGQDLKLDNNSPVREGYIFQGWGTTANSTVATCQPGTTYTANADLNLFAVWKAKTYTITYNANGGKGAPASESKTHGESKKLSTTTPEREGYTFQGWATSSSSSTVAYNAGDTYVGNANLELYAVWKANTYTITYNANGGNLDKVPSTQTKTHGVAATLNANSPVRDGYIFKGWGTSGTATTIAYQPGDTYSTDADLKIFAIWKEGNFVNVDGLGNVEVKDKNIELDYDPGTGELGGKVPPTGNTPETAPEIPKENLPEIIEFGFGEFESKTTYTPGTYETVPYETTYTVTKLPVVYWNRIWSEWKITKDANGNVIKTEPGNMELADIDEKYSTYIVYDFETEEALEANGVKGDSVELWTIYNATEDSLENAVYLAAYLNKQDGKTSRHIAKWNGSQYVAYDADSDISAVNTFVEAYTVTGTKQVQVTAPSSSTEYVYIPTGTLKAEKGMTWAEWLASDYNTTGETAPIIKTKDFVDVSYNSTIVAGEEYGFVVYKLSGMWKLNDSLSLNKGISENILFTSSDNEFNAMNIIVVNDSIFMITYTLVQPDDDFAEVNPYASHVGWGYPIYKDIDFGSTPQTVSKEFYEWFTANATKVEPKTLASVVEIGDYVDYGIEYNNVIVNNHGDDEISTLTGWRVISKNNDGTINLVSAGAPLTYYPGEAAIDSPEKLTNNFLNILLSDTEDGTFRMSGFDNNKSLAEVFKENKYTVMNQSVPMVRSINQEDILNITGDTDVVLGTELDLANNKYNDLFSIGVNYYLANSYIEYPGALLFVFGHGSISTSGYSSYGIRPVVSIKPGVLTTGKDSNGVWNLVIE